MEQLKIAWKVDSKNDDMPIKFTYLSLDDFDNLNSINDVRSKIEAILKQDFEAGIDYIVYDFYHISSKIFDKVVVNSNFHLNNSNHLSNSIDVDYLKSKFLGIILYVSILTIFGFIGFFTIQKNQLFDTAAIDSGVTPKDIAFGVKEVKTYTNSMATHALGLNKQCVEKLNKDACVEYKRLYDTFLNGGLNLDTGIRIEESKPTIAQENQSLSSQSNSSQDKCAEIERNVQRRIRSGENMFRDKEFREEMIEYGGDCKQ